MRRPNASLLPLLRPLALRSGLLAMLALWLPARGVPAEGPESVVIAAGPEGGSYHHIAARLKTELILRNETLPEVQTTSGALENLALLGDPESPVNVALAQADALRAYFEAQPDSRERVAVLGDMGAECVLLVAAREGGPRSAEELKRGPSGAGAGAGAELGTVAVDAPTSGPALTYRSLTGLEPALAATRAVHAPTLEALLELVEGQAHSSLRAVMLVQRPSRESPALRSVLDAPDRYRFIALSERDVPNAALPDGSSIYSFERVAVGAASRAERPEIETLCTRALLVSARDKLSRDLRSRLSRLLLEARAQISGSEH